MKKSLFFTILSKSKNLQVPSEIGSLMTKGIFESQQQIVNEKLIRRLTMQL